MKTEKIIEGINRAESMSELTTHMDYVLKVIDECDFTEWQFQKIQLAAREKNQQLTKENDDEYSQ